MNHPSCKTCRRWLDGLFYAKSAVVVFCRKKLETAAKIVLRQTVRKQLSCDSTKREFFAILYFWACQTVFITKLLWLLLGKLERQLKQLAICCRPTNMGFLSLPHWMKAAYSLNSKRIGTITLICHRVFLFWNRYWTELVITKFKTERIKFKKHEEESKVSAADEETEKDAPAPLITFGNNISQQFFSHFRKYHMILHFFNSGGLFRHILYTSNNLNGAISEHKGILHFKG